MEFQTERFQDTISPTFTFLVAPIQGHSEYLGFTIKQIPQYKQARPPLLACQLACLMKG